MHFTHGHTVGHNRAPEYNAFVNARQRCLNPNNSKWPRYGGRGIEFRFKSFLDFLKELGPKPSPNHSVDRIDNDGHYEPGNVRWATGSEQVQNTERCLVLRS